MRADVAFHMGPPKREVAVSGTVVSAFGSGLPESGCLSGSLPSGFHLLARELSGKRRLWIVPQILMPLAIKRTESHQAFWLVSAGRGDRHRKGKPITDKHAAPDLASENADLAEPSRWAQL